MNLNIIAYIIYGILTTYITVIVGYKFHKYGLIYIINLTENKAFSIAINNILLLLYYCLNLGYVVLIISFWENIENMQDMINSIGTRSGTIILFLGVMHYFNLTWIYLLHKYKSKFKTIKK
jgi:hypothetical protein